MGTIMRTSNKILRSILAFSLLFGTLFVPARAAEAGFFSSLFTDQALASANISTLSKTGDNSQSSANALQVSDSSQVGNNKDEDNNSVAIDDTGTAIIAPTGPMGVSDGSSTLDSSGNDTSVYVVRDGDSLSQIAKMFGVSVDTILWANDMKKGDKLTPGDVLLILPVSGIEYTVKAKDSLQSIAKLYKVDVSDIIQNNDITLDTPLNPGDTLIIPNAEEPESKESGKPIQQQDLGASIAKDRLYYEQHPVKNLAGYYVDPVPGYRLSQGIHDNNAVDLAVPRGTPVHAAASGTVTFARLGYNGGFGGLVIISHPNGTETLYAHLSKLSAYTGENVDENQVIANSGGVPGTPYAGHSTGAHLHFEVHGAQNPGVDGSWKY